MDLIKPGTLIDFMKFNRIAAVVSLALIFISIGFLATKGLNYGIDFAGGTEIQVQFADDVTAEKLRGSLEDLGMGDARIQSIGDENEFMIRTLSDDEAMQELSARVDSGLKEVFGKENVEVRKVDMVGSEVSHDLKQKGYLSLLYACVAILIYIAIRFEFKFALGAVLALIHDVTITVGIFALTGREVTLPVIAALLTIIGYSLNDTIVVFDRIRENHKKDERVVFKDLLNGSISQTLSRTLLTSLTTFIVVFCLYLFGGSVINNFAFAMMIGVLIGTYSSVFVASPVLLLMTKDK